MIDVLHRRLKHSKGIFTRRPGSSAAWSLTVGILGFLAVLTWPHQVVALSSVPYPNTWITSGIIDGNGTVYAIVDNSTMVYIGGYFDYVGPNTGFGAPLNTLDGSLPLTYPKVNGVVNVAVPDGSGGWYIGGDFTRVRDNVGDYQRNYLAHIRLSGDTFVVDPTWAPEPSNIDPDSYATVLALAVSPDGNTVYAGGAFDTIGGQPRNYIAALNAAGNGDATPWDPNANDWVRTLAVRGTTVYAGGDFSTIGRQPRNYIAALNAAGNGDATTWNPNANDWICALAVSPDNITVYAGGFFSSTDGVEPSIGGQPRNYIAALNATDSGTATTWDPNANGFVWTLAVSPDGNTVYTGGDFISEDGVQASIGGQPRDFIAALNTTDNGTATSWKPNADNTVWTLDLNGTTVYAGGFFTTIGGQPRKYIAALNTTDNGTATSSWSPIANDIVNAVAVSSNSVYAGGYFTSIGGQMRSNLAALDASGAVTSWGPNPNGTVNALVVNGVKLYVGGAFSKIAGGNRGNVARFTFPAGSLDQWNRNANDTVNALMVKGTNLYIGGAFTHIGGASVQQQYLVSYSTLNDAIRASWNPNPNGPVLALAGSGNTVYAGGTFNEIGYQSPRPERNNIAALNDTDNGTATPWNPNADGPVFALAVGVTDVYAAGSFFSIGYQSPQERSNIAALSTIDNGTATSWNPNASDAVWALALSGDTIYAGGDFTSIGAQTVQPERNHVAALHTTDNGTANSWNPNVDLDNPFQEGATVRVLALGSGHLHVGGYFTTVGGRSQPNLTRFDGATAIGLASFAAEGSDDHVSLIWETGFESENAGFRLWRSKIGSGGYKKITPSLIPSEGHSYGATYSYEDRSVKLGTTYYYRLEAVDYEGVSAFYGPISATVGDIWLTSPKNGASVPARVPPNLGWRSHGFNRFQIQFSSVASFASGVTTMPKALKGKDGALEDQWMTEEVYTPTPKEWRTIINLAPRGKPLFWRVYGKNDVGNSITSETNRITIK
jgi:trimeric autotransporter adhesin